MSHPSVNAAPVLTAVTRAELRSAFDNAPIGMAVVAPTGVITSCNGALCTLLDRSMADLVGRTFFDVTHTDDLTEAREKCRLMQAGAARVLRHECRFLRPDGTVLWVLVSTSRVPEQAGAPAHLIMHIEDLSERKQLEEELSHRALHDPLTGLANRTLLLDRITGALARQERTPSTICLFFLDLDDFKAVNDTYGHGAGDRVLQLLAARLTALLRPTDTAARLGGDEFAVLCEDTDERQGAIIAERVRALAAEPYLVDGHTVLLTAAVGVCAAGGPLEPDPLVTDPVGLLHRADLQMYKAKKLRRTAADATGG